MCLSSGSVPRRVLLLTALLVAGAGGVQLAVGLYFFLPVPVLQLGSNIWTGAWNLVSGGVMVALGWRQALGASLSSFGGGSSRLQVQLTLASASLALSLVNVVVVELGEWRLMRHRRRLPSADLEMQMEEQLRLARAASDAASVVASVAAFLAAHLAFCLLQQRPAAYSPQKPPTKPHTKEVFTTIVPPPPPLPAQMLPVKTPPTAQDTRFARPMTTFGPAAGQLLMPPPSSRVSSPCPSSTGDNPEAPSSSSGYGSPDACCVSYRHGPRGAVTVISVGSKFRPKSHSPPMKRRRARPNPRSLSLRRTQQVHSQVCAQPIARSVSFCDSVLRRSTEWSPGSSEMSCDTRSVTPVTEDDPADKTDDEVLSAPESSSLASPSSPVPNMLLERLLGHGPHHPEGTRVASASLASLSPFLQEAVDQSETLAYLSELELLARHWRAKILQRQIRNRHSSSFLRGTSNSHSHC